MVQMALSSEAVLQLSNMECFMFMQNFSQMEEKIIFSVLTKQKGVWFEQMPWGEKLNEAEQRASMSSD